jgi:glycerol-3-phosphate O-acyltransferase
VQQLKTKFCDGLAMDLAYTLSENLVVMSTNIVASMLLIDRQGGVTEEELVNRSTWLFKEIQERKGYMAMNTNPSQTSVRNSLNFLKNFVDFKKDVFQPMVKANKDYKNILMLAYYRNNLIHLFINEGYIACALNAFGEYDSQ